MLLVLMAATAAQAVDLTFSWLPNGDAATSYRLYYGDASRMYTGTLDVGNPDPVDGRITGTITDIPYGVEMYYAVTAYNPGAESDYSNEVVHAVPWPVPGTPADLTLKVVINVNVNVEQQ